MKPESVHACSTNETQASTTRPLRHAQRKSNVNFKCSNCQRRFPSVLRLRRHLNLVHRGAGKLLWCSKCSIAFNEVSAFVQHSRIHHREKTREDSRPSGVTHDKLPPFHSDTCVFGGVERQDGANYSNTQNDESNATAFGKSSNGDSLPEVKDDSTNENDTTEYNALNSNTNVLSDVVTQEAITVTVTRSDVGHMEGVSERNEEPLLRESPKPNQNDSISFTKNQQSSVGFEHDCTSRSFLQGHPTMANIGASKSCFHITPDAPKAQRPVVSKNGTKGGPKIVKQHREAVGIPHQNQFQLHNEGMDCPLNSIVDNLNISVPSNIQTINLMAETRSNVLQERLERSETMMYLRSVTAKLDAIIRHFNVPFSEGGSALLTPPLRTMQMQSIRPTSDLEQESQPDTPSFNPPPHLPRKRSSPSDMDCNGANSPVLQRAVDAFHSKPSSDDGTIKLESGLPFSCSGFGDDSIYNADGIVLPEDLIRDLHSKSLNRGNFAKHLVFQLFTPEERKGKNCFGRRAGLQSGPKAPLDPIRLQYVRDKVFQYYPCEPGLEETIWRRQCVIAVDTALRGENRPHKKLM